MTSRLAMLLAVLAVLAGPARADSGRALGLDDLIDVAEEIVVGEVLGSTARWQGRLVVTDTTVRVVEPLKGSAPSEITLTQPGGTAVHPRLGAEVTTQASSFTALRSGETVVLFVEQRSGVRRLVGAQQGKLVVQTEPEGSAPALAVGPKRLRAVPEARETTIGAHGMTLDELRARIRARSEGRGR